MSPSLRVRVDGDGAWSDLARKPNKVLRVSDAAVEIAALAGGMVSGRASVMLRVDLPDGRAVLIESSLRALHAAVTAIVAKHGEPFMQHPLSEREHKLALGMRDLVRQLEDAKRRLGEPFELNLETGDATWDREQQLRKALSLARALLLEGKPMSSDDSREIDDALAGRRRDGRENVHAD